jgi:predicted transcriptional regulator
LYFKPFVKSILERHFFLVTAASFIVFNGAMKTTSDIKAKVSVVEGTVKNLFFLDTS